MSGKQDSVSTLFYINSQNQPSTENPAGGSSSRSTTRSTRRRKSAIAQAKRRSVSLLRSNRRQYFGQFRRSGHRHAAGEVLADPGHRLFGFGRHQKRFGGDPGEEPVGWHVSVDRIDHDRVRQEPSIDFRTQSLEPRVCGRAIQHDFPRRVHGQVQGHQHLRHRLGHT